MRLLELQAASFLVHIKATFKNADFLGRLLPTLSKSVSENILALQEHLGKDCSN